VSTKEKSSQPIVTAVCTSREKGTAKTSVERGSAIEGFGFEGDAHGGFKHRQISLLAEESIAKMRALGLDVQPGSFGENLTTRGMDLVSLPVGTVLGVGDRVLLRVSQIGKECHTPCAIYHQIGDCIMPREGIFAEFLAGGEIRSNDPLRVIEEN